MTETKDTRYLVSARLENNESFSQTERDRSAGHERKEETRRRSIRSSFGKPVQTSGGRSGSLPLRGRTGMTKISQPSTPASIRLYSRTNRDVRHLACQGHHQRIHDDLSDIFRLEKKFRFVLPSLRLKNSLHARRGCPPGIDTEHSNPIR